MPVNSLADDITITYDGNVHTLTSAEVDVRTANEYDLMHIKNAINIPVNEIEQRIFQVDSTHPLMVYCSSGARSKTAIQILNNLGYNNIYIWEYGALATFPYKNMLVYGENGRII